MLRFVCLCACLLVANIAAAKDATLSFDKENYQLAFVDKRPSLALNEYILPGKTLDNWDKMVALHVFHKQNSTPMQYAEKLGEVVKSDNPQAGYRVIINHKTGEAIIDFITWTNKDPIITEFNIFKIRKGDAAGDLIAMQYAYRTYGTSMEEFERFIKDNRERLTQLVAETAYPDFVEQMSPQ